MTTRERERKDRKINKKLVIVSRYHIKRKKKRKRERKKETLR